jgi:hypothetical protein
VLLQAIAVRSHEEKMTVFSQKTFDGHLFVEHRASPGLTEEQALAFGYDPFLCREGKVYEAATLGCPHCESHIVKNPKRTRARAFCTSCNRYIYDWCDAARSDPDYVHRTGEQIRELLSNGWGMSGSIHNPTMTPPNKGIVMP